MGANSYADLAYTSLETITAFDLTTGEYLWTLDELQDAKIANTEDSSDITGKQGRLLNTIKKNKATTISGNNGLISGGMMATQVGGSFESKTTTQMYPDFLTVTNNKATTTYKAVGTTGNEIGYVIVHNADGSTGKKLTQDATAGKDKFAYKPDTKELTFNTGDLQDGTEIAVYYKRSVQGGVLDNISDQYSQKVELYIDGFAEDRCNKIYRIQYHVPVADFNGNFDIDMGGDQAVHAFEAKTLASRCGTSKSTLWTYIVVGEDEPDAE